MGLDRLIETERRNDDLLRSAREEAAELVRSATEQAARRRETLAVELDAELWRREAAARAERDRRLAHVRETAEDMVARYDAVSEDRVRAAAAALIEQLVGEGAAP